MHILIAEDDPTAREIARLLLTRTGHEAMAVADGAAALAALLGGNFGAALLDLHMPLMDGAEVARSVAAAMPEGSRPRLIALTAAAGPGSEPAILAHGFDACLAKPLRLPALAAALAGAEPPLTTMAASPLPPQPAAALDAGPILEAHASGDMGGLAHAAAELKGAAVAEHPMLAALCARLGQALARRDAHAVAELVAAIAAQTGRA